MEKPSKDFISDAIFLVDSSSFIFRAYYGLNSSLTAPDGTPTHATFGFIQMLNSLVREHAVTKLALIWDTKEKNFRHQLFPEYKANRQEPPEDLSLQIENAQKLADLLGFKQFSLVGYEADDVLASYVHQFPNKKFVVVTSDKDLLQLVNKNVWLLDTFKKKWSNAESCLEKFGVPPKKVAYVQALSGDSVDNVPGVPGVGPKTATELIQTFGDLEGVLKEAQIRFKNTDKKVKYADALKGKKIENIAKEHAKARVSLSLVDLAKDVPLPISADELLIEELHSAELLELATQLGFKKIAEQCAERLGVEGLVDVGVAKIETEALGPTKPSGFELIVINSFTELQGYLEGHSDKKSWAMDTETFGLDRFAEHPLVGLSLAWEEKSGVYIPLRHQENTLNRIEIRKMLECLHDFFANNVSEVIFQNAKFDLHILGREGFELPKSIVLQDTMVASYVLNPAGSHGLDYLVDKYLQGYRMLPFKEVLGDCADFSHVVIKKAAFYAAEDAVKTWELWQVLAKALNDDGLYKVYEKIDCPLLKVLLEMERVGFRLDLEFLSNLSATYHKELVSMEKSAHDLLDDYGVVDHHDLNFSSPKQLQKILFEDLKLPITKKTKTGASTDVSVLRELSFQHPFPEILLEIRELNKLLSTYIDALPNMVKEGESRVHTDFSQTTAETGRLSSTNPNLQNIPVRTPRGAAIRKAFVAADGYELVGLDYSQIELRVLAHMSGDAQLLDAFAAGADIHKRTASLVLKKKESQVSDDERRLAKTVNFGILYGQTAFGLAKTLGISRSEAKDFIEAYFASYKSIKTFLASLVEGARNNTYVETLCGRRRYIKDIDSKNFTLRAFAERMAINSPIQGSAADIMKVAMLNIYRKSLEAFPKVRMILQVHDEMLFECPEGVGENFLLLAKQVFENDGLLADFGVKSFKVPLLTQGFVDKVWVKA